VRSVSPIEKETLINKNAIAKGISDGILGAKIGDMVYFREPIFEETITEFAYVIKKEIAEQEKGRLTGVPIGEGTAFETKKKEEEFIKVSATKGVTKKVRIKARIPYDKLNNTISGVIKPLKNEGAEVQLELAINAESVKGIKKDTLQLRIKETLNQIRARIIDWEEI
jgi:hypothetical protein